MAAVKNYRITVGELGSGWAALLVADVSDETGTYTDCIDTGISRYATREEAEQEAKSWAMSDGYLLEGV